MGYNIFGSLKYFWESDESDKTFLYEMYMLHSAYNFRVLEAYSGDPLSL